MVTIIITLYQDIEKFVSAVIEKYNYKSFYIKWWDNLWFISIFQPKIANWTFPIIFIASQSIR